MRKALITMLLVLIAVASQAAKISPFPVTITQSDGSQLTVIGYGDEYHSWYTTTDGVLLVQQGTDYFIARVADDGTLAATTQLAHELSARGAQEITLANAQDRDRFKSQLTANRARAIRRIPVAADQKYFPHTGAPKAVVILVEFQDSVFSLPDPKKSFDLYMNGNGNPRDEAFVNGESSLAGAVTHYFQHCSFGQFTPTFEILGPVKVPHKTEYFSGTSNGVTLIKEACELVDADFDFSDPAYDLDGDGQVDAVCAIFAGYSRSITGNASNCIHPHANGTYCGTFDGKKVGRWCVVNELNGFPGAYSNAPYKHINGIGLFCHEFSHCMGLPDLYPTVASSRADNQEMEFWSLMDGGEYLSNGNCPTAYTAWEREAMGWMEIDELNAETDLADIEIRAIDEGGKAYRIRNANNTSGREYFMLENIQPVKFNQAAKGHGLLVYHVNYPFGVVNSSDNPNNTKGSPCMAVVPADGLLFSQYKVQNPDYINPATGTVYSTKDYYDQLAGDLFPGTSGVKELNKTLSLPNFKFDNGTTVNHALTGITENAEERFVTFRYVNDYDHWATGIDVAITEHPSATDPRVFTLDGRQAGTDLSRLPKGIYIIGGKKQVIK